MAWIKAGITAEDCIELAPRLRKEDLIEIQAVCPGVSIVDSLIESAQVSYKSFSVMEEGLGCLAIFGVRKVGDRGIPWLLTSDLLLTKFSRFFLENCRDYVGEVLRDFTFAYNYVSVDNTRTHRWLRWLGFHVDTSFITEQNGVGFHPFTYTRNNNV